MGSFPSSATSCPSEVLFNQYEAKEHLKHLLRLDVELSNITNNCSEIFTQVCQINIMDKHCNHGDYGFGSISSVLTTVAITRLVDKKAAQFHCQAEIEQGQNPQPLHTAQYYHCVVVSIFTSTYYVMILRINGLSLNVNTSPFRTSIYSRLFNKMECFRRNGKWT